MINKLFLKYPVILWRDVFLILVISLFIFSFRYIPEFISFQIRFAIFTKEMFRNGMSLFPTLYQSPYPDYFSTMTLLSYGLSKLLGHVSSFTVFFPTAVISSLVLVVTYLIGSLHSRIWGWYAVLISLLTFSFLHAVYNNVSMDQAVSLVAALSFYIVYSNSIYKTSEYLKIFIYVLAVIGFIFRGPIGFVIPIGVVEAFYLYERRFKDFTWTLILSALILVICGLVELALAYIEGGWTFVHRVISFQLSKRLGDEEQVHSFYFYWWNPLANYAISYPLAWLVVIAQRKAIWKRENSTARFLGALAGWVLIILVGMSIPLEKRLRYILPIIPALSLITASLLVISSEHYLMRWGRKLLIFFCRIIPYISIALIILIILFAKQLKLHEIPSYFYIISLGILLILAFWEWFNRYQYRNQLQSVSYYLHSLVIAVSVVLTMNWFIYQPINYQLEKSRPFIEQFEKAYLNKPAPLVFYNIGPDSTDLKFISNLKLSLIPVFIHSSDQLDNLRKPFYLIISDKNYSTLSKSEKSKLKIIARGSIGHLPCILLSRIH